MNAWPVLSHQPSLAVVGLGKLGSPMAAVLASKGFEVTGVDLNQVLVDAVNAGRAPVEEPRLQEYVDKGQGRLRATTDIRAAIAASDVTFVIVPTPSGSDMLFTNRHVLAAMADIGVALRGSDRYHLVVVTSTVMPGSTGGPIRLALEQASGRKVGPSLGLCYNPEFIALGTVIHDMLNPDFVLIGESDAKAGDLLAAVQASALDKKAEFRRMSFVNAELTKIAVNTFVTTKISYANMLAEFCDRLPGADVDVVTHAVGADSRIGTRYLRGGVGYGGPCFPRDNKAFAALGRQLGACTDLAEATDTVNVHQVRRIADAVGRVVACAASVAVLGLSYKPMTGVVEESHGVLLARELSRRGYAVRVHDPLGLPNARLLLGNRADYSRTAAEALAGADAAVVMTPWPEYQGAALAGAAAGLKVVVDPWRVVSAEALPDTVLFLCPGRGGASTGLVDAGLVEAAA